MSFEIFDELFVDEFVEIFLSTEKGEICLPLNGSVKRKDQDSIEITIDRHDKLYKLLIKPKRRKGVKK